MPEIGRTLQEARMRAGIDISEVEAATKIRAKYLRAIENEEWAMLPGPTFVKSFLRTYADHLGIDGKLLVEEYKLRHEPMPAEHEVQPIGPIGEPRRLRTPRPPRLSRGWLVGLSVAGLLVLLIVLGSIGNQDEETPVATGPPTTTTRRQAPARPRPRPAPQVVRLSLVPSDTVYVCLRDRDGNLVLNQFLSPDEGQRSFQGRRFRVTVGRPAVQIRVDGRSLPVPDNGEPVTYELKPGVRTLLPGVNACESGTGEGAVE